MSVGHAAASRLTLAALLAMVSGACLFGCTAARSDPQGETSKPTVSAADLAAGRALSKETFQHAWNLIRTTYPYEDMKGLDWQAVHDELIPKAELAATPSELRPVLEEMIHRLGESHFAIFPGTIYGEFESLSAELKAQAEAAPSAGQAGDAPSGKTPSAPSVGQADEGGVGDVGIDTRILDGEVVVTRVDAGGPASGKGVKPGWVLERIGSVEAAELVKTAKLAAGDPKTGDFFAHHAVAAALVGSPGTTVQVTFRDGRQSEREVEITRRKSPGEVFRFGNLPEVLVDFHSEILPGTRTGYLRFNIFLTPVGLPFSQAIKEFIEQDVEGIIIDVRGNPGGIGAMVMGMAGHFIAEPDKVLGKLKTRHSDMRFVAFPRPPSSRFDGKVAVLIDGLSASTSEILAAGLQGQGTARVFGTRSAGMALPSVIEALPNGDRLQFVTADLTAPDGTRLEGLGVAPDEEVALNAADLRAGGDRVVASAIAWIQLDGGTGQH